ncbi:hypothetical protein EDC01DRAFT_727418 [Geopyxis carbonaria]|nr:hypothetical protein EDC01DRAFT_727418 [Geopyxis carbonaria]
MSGGTTTGNIGGTSDSTSPAPKRLRVSRACEQCRSRKSKCDGQTPVCSPCASLSQQCTYGSQPKKRGLAPGSVSALEKTVKLLQRCLGLLLVTVPGSEEALLALVQQYSKALLDGEEGKRLTAIWKESGVIEALDALQTESTGFSRPLPPKASRIDIPAGSNRSDAHFRVHFSPDGCGVSRQGERNFSEQDRVVGHEGHPDEMTRECRHAENPPGPIDQGDEPTAEYEAEMAMNYDVNLAQPAEDQILRRNLAFSPPSLSAIPVSEATSSPSAAPGYTPHQSPADSFQRPLHQPRSEADSTGIPAAFSSLLRLDDESFQLPQNSRQLLDNYFSYTHIWFPILDKYDVVRLHHTINRQSKQANPSVQPVTPAKRALLYAVLSQASLQQEIVAFQAAENDKAKQALRRQAMSGKLYKQSQDLIFTSEEYTLHHVQALLILSLINISQSQLKTAWYIIGHAGRISVELGIRAPGVSSFARRTWMGYLILESLISLFIGRAPLVNEADWKILSIPEDGWEEWDEWRGVWKMGTTSQNMGSTDDTNVPAHMLSVFNQLVRLAGIIRRIAVQRIFRGESESRGRASSRSSTPISQPDAENSLQKLQIWLHELTPQCTLKQPAPGLSILPHVANLHLLYSYAILCVPDGFPSGDYGPAATHAARVKETATATVLQTFRSCQPFGIAPCTFVHLADATNQIDNLALQSLRTFKQDFASLHMYNLQASKTLLRKLASPLDLLQQPKEQIQPLSHSHTGFSTGPEMQTSPGGFSIPDQVSPSPYPLVVGGPSSSAGVINLPTSDQSFYGSSSSTIAPQSMDRPSTFSMSIREEDLNASNINTQTASSMTGLLFSMPQDSASPDSDVFDDEMAMLESLPWTQNGIPEFMQNLGYVGGLGPQNAAEGQREMRDQAPELDREEGASPDQGQNVYAGRGLNTVLEQWLGDVLGAGNGNSGGGGSGPGGGGGGGGGRGR